MTSRAGRCGGRLRISLLASTALICSSPTLQAQTWTGATSADWFDGTNWSPATVPVGGEQPVIDTTTPNAPIIDGGIAPTAPAAGVFPQIFIGNSATGTLTIQNAGILNADNAFIGNNAGSNGTVTMTGASVWNSTNTSNGIIVGFNGTGTFNLTTGSTVNSANTIVGFGAASNGTVTVDNSVWNQTGASPLSALFVGYGGTGSFTVQSAGTAATVNTYVGHLAGSSGTATVTGAGSTWTSTESIFVGNFGTGTFNVLAGGVVTTTQDTVLGFAAGSAGTINVDGVGSTWNTTRDIIVGGNGVPQAGGTGIFNVTNGGAVTVNRDTVISASAGGVGTVTVTDAGSSWTNTRDIFIGGVTSGTFNVLNGATVTANRDTSLGVFAGSTGTLNVDGAGSTWTNATANRFMIVGGTRFGATGGAGIVNVTNGGQITSEKTFIGYSAGSTGNVTVTGTGSTWTMNGNSVIGGNDGIGIGSGGTGVVNVLNGGALVSNAFLILGNSNDGVANGTLNVSGAGTTFTGGNVEVGGSGTGALNITGGAIANVTGVIVGNCLCSTGTVNVSGTGTTLTSSGGYIIGFDGRATVNVTNGGAAQSGGDVYVGAGLGTGALNVNGSGTFTTVAGLILGQGSNASATVSGIGSTITVGTSTVIGAGGTGNSSLSVLSGATANLGSIFLGSPFLGSSSTGILTVDATSLVNGTGYAQGGIGTFAVGISPTQNGLVAITGGSGIDLTAAGALVVNAKTTVAKKYNIMTTDGAVLGTFSSVTVVGNANNLRVNYNVPCGVGCLAIELSVDTFSVSNVLPPGTGGNPANVAAALDRAIIGGATFPDQFFNVFALTGSNLVNALSQISGEGVSATQNAAFGAGSQFNGAMMNQSQIGSTSGSISVTVPATQYAGSRAARGSEAFASLKPAPDATQTGRWRIWSAGFAASHSLRGEAAAVSSSQSIRNYGGVLGFDHQLTPDLLVGFAAGGSESNFSVPNLFTSGQSTGGHVGVYALKTWGAYYAAAALSYSRFDNSTRRDITGFGANEVASARFGSDQISGRLELGWKRLTAFGMFTSFVAIEPAALWQRGFTESSVTAGGGNGVFGLTVASRTATSLPTFVGMQFDTRKTLANGAVFEPFARVSWVHEFEPNRQVSAGFVTVPSAIFTVDGARAASDAARVDAGAKLALRGGETLFANFTGEWSDRTQSYAGTAGFRVAW